jgi:hypothetical protein
MDYFTLQVTYNNPTHDKAEVIEFKDIEGWINVKQFQHSIWVSGFRKQLTPTSWELISPFRITRALVMKQDTKYAI